MSASEDLGRLQKTYPGQSISSTDFFLWVMPGVLAALSLVFYGVYLRYTGYTQSALRPAGWLALAGLALLPSGALVLRRFSSAARSVSVHANGLRLKNIRSDSPQLLWCQINGIRTIGIRYHFFGLAVADRLALVIEPVHGKNILVPSSIRKIEELVDVIKKRIYPILLPSLTADLEQGQTLNFGMVRINPEHLAAGRKTLPWSSVRNLQVDGGSLLILKENEQVIRVPVSEIMNVDLLLQLLDQHFSTN